MTEQNRKKIFSVIFLLCFLGIVLSFSLFLYMSRSMYSENEGEFFGSSYGISEDDMLEYDSRFMKNKTLHSAIIESEYRAFGNVKQKDVIKGKRDFLFDFGVNKFGYDYAADYFGRRSFKEGELEAFLEAVEMRRQAYAEQGRQYMLVVIPNVQTVYSEYMPTYFAEMSENTGLRQLTRYMRENGVSCFVDLTDSVKASKSSGVLYNNTENSINALGAYFVYASIMNEMPESISALDRTLDITDFAYYTHYTEGKDIAVKAGLEAIIRNETVSMSNATEFKYTVVARENGLETTFVKTVYKNELPINPSVLIDCSGEWDKIQLMPYFSNTFGVVSYKTGHEYSREAVDSSNPHIVVQTIHEDELPMLLDSSINLSYNRAFGEDTTPHKTSAPSQVEYSVIDSNSACITGVIEQDADIRVFGENLGIISAKAIDGRFFVRVRFDDEVNGKEIFLDAKSPDKAASDHVSLIISGVNNVGSARNVFIGSTSMLYKADYQVPYDLPADDMLSIYREELSESFGRIRENSGNNGVNMLLSIVPQKISVYTEGLNSELAAQSARLEQIRGTFAELLDDSGIETLDLSEMLKKRASSDKMLYQTSESITDLAYYYMYCAITARLYDMTDEYKWAFMPIRPENFMEYTMPVTTGEHTSLLGFDEKAVTETVTRLKYENSKKIVNVSDGSKIYFGGKATLPTAVIVCDRIGEPLLDLLSEHFRYCYVLRINETVVPDDVLSAVDPDFIIYICDEGKIDFTVGY